MTIKSMLTAAIIAAGTATALAAPAAADEQADQQFLAAIAENGVQAGSDAKAINLAQSMCRKLGNGSKKGVETALYYIKDNSSFSNDQITTFAGIAVQVYCPERAPS
ncbi:MAG: DUF732 domain-containing protein [Microbacteriaceae bacterium]